MSYDTNITAGTPPLLWSSVQEAFEKINSNFEILEAALGASGITPVDFGDLNSSVIPAIDNVYELGTSSKRWRAVHAAGYIEGGADAGNGLWAGSAQIKGIGAHIDIPPGSTIAGSLIIDPDKTFFKTIDVDNGNSIVATGFGDTVKFLSGSGISMSVDSAAESLTIDNTGILTVAAGSGVSVSTVSGTATVTNTGVRSLTSVTALPSGRTAGAGINIDNSTGDGIKITNAGVISISNGVGITVSTDAATGDVTITNSAPAQNGFAQFEINGDFANRITADSVSDVMFINSGQGIALTKDPVTDTLTITVDPVFDLTGSVFADDSTKLVDAVEGLIVGNIDSPRIRTSETKIALGLDAGAAGANAIAIGEMAGQTTQGNRALAVGFQAGFINQGARAIAIGQGTANGNQGANGIAIGETAAAGNQGTDAIAIGQNAAQLNQGNDAIAIGRSSSGDNQGIRAIAIGNFAAAINQTSGSIVINATGSAITASAAGFYVDPVRNQTGAGGVVQYDSSTKEISYSTTIGSVSGTFTGNIFTNLIDSADSSAITVTPATIFSSDVTVENELSVAGSKVINLAQLQEVVAASADFTDFQARIAALV